MPSRSLTRWQTTTQRELGEIEDAHRAVGGRGRGRRYATQQINHAYVMLLSSQFQRFCRDLHSEAAEHLSGAVGSVVLRVIFRAQLTLGRKLDVGNPNPGNLGSDFERLGLNFWPSILARGDRNRRRRDQLEFLNRWRNAVAHQDFTTVARVGRASLGLEDVRRWRAACNALAVEFDRVVASYLATILGVAPW